MLKKNIVLIGIMGSGKSTLGKILAKNLRMNFLDTDLLIEKECKLKIKDIFQKYGEKYFRKKEEKIVNKILSKENNSIIALGGGTFLNKNLQKKILRETISIWLKASFKIIYNRCKNSNHRPLLQNKNNLNTSLKKLINDRYPIYRKANIIIIANKTPKILCDIIKKKINKINNL